MQGRLIISNSFNFLSFQDWLTMCFDRLRFVCRKVPRKVMRGGSAWHRFPPLRGSAQAPDPHTPPTHQSKNLIIKQITHTHTSQKKFSDEFCSLSKPPWRSHTHTFHLLKVSRLIAFSGLPSLQPHWPLCCSSNNPAISSSSWLVAFLLLFPLSNMFFLRSSVPLIFFFSS